MQRLKTFWASGVLGKIAILGAVALVGLCVCAGIGSLARPPATPAPVSQVKATGTNPPQPTAKPTIQPAAANTASPNMDAARAAFTEWLTTTVCSPGTADNPMPAWCSTITGASFLPPTLLVTTSLTPTDRDGLRDMASKFGAFVYNNNYKKFGLTRIQIVSAKGETLVERKGLEYDIEFPQ